MSHDDGLYELSAALESAGLQNELYHDCIYVLLPHEQGAVEVRSMSEIERAVHLHAGRDCTDLVERPGEFDGPPEEVTNRLMRRLMERGINFVDSLP